MKSLFTYSRLVLKHPGELPGSAREAIVEKAGKVGEVIGGAYESSAEFLKRIEFLKTSKNALQALRDGFNRNANPLEKYPSEAEKNKQLIDYVAKQIGCPSRDLKDALYAKFSPDVNEARKNKRHDIVQRLIVLQALVPEMELTFVGATTTEVRNLGDHDAAWYMKKKNTFNEMLELYIGPLDVGLYLNQHLNEIREFANSSNPMMVAKKYPQVFFGSIPLKGQPGKYEINGHNLLDVATAYEKARDYSNLLHRSPDVRKSSLGIPPAQHYDLYVFETPQAREFGVTMKYRKIGEGQVGASGISDEPASRRAESGSSSAAGEKAPDGKEGERLDPIGDLDTYATKKLKHKWKGIKLDPDIDAKRYKLSDLTQYVARLERVLQDMDTNAKYKEFWPIMSEIAITVTPNDVRDINIFSEGFSWDDGKLKVDYDESENSIREDIVDGLRAYNSYKKLGGAERVETQKGREELIKQTKAFLDNYDILFTPNAANKLTWKNHLEDLRDPQKFRALVEKDPQYVEKHINSLRESVRFAYHTKLYYYITNWDAKIGAGNTDGGGFTKKQWVDSNNSIADNKPEANSARDINFVVPWVQYFQSHLDGKPVPAPVIPGFGGAEKHKEKTPEIDANRRTAELALNNISTKYGYPISMLPTRVKSQTYEYDYKDIVSNANAIDAALLDIRTKEGPDRIAILEKFGLSPTPKRTMDYKIRREGYQTLPDGTKRILFKVSDNPTEMAIAISNGLDEIEEKDADAAAKTAAESGEGTPQSKEVIKTKIIETIKNRSMWNKQTPEARERENFAKTNSSLTKIAKIFGVAGDPGREDFPYKLLGDALYGPEEIPETATDLTSQVKRMLLKMSNTYKFNIELQDGVDYNYEEILGYKNKFNSVFGSIKPNTKNILAKSGVVLGEQGMMNDQEGVIRTNDGKYRIAIDYNDDESKIAKALDKYADEYESEAKSLRKSDTKELNDIEAKKRSDTRLEEIKKANGLKGIDYESGFDDYKDLLNYTDGIKTAFSKLSPSDKKKLSKGDYQIIVSNAGTFQTEGWVSDHTILIDYREKPEDIRSDLSAGIEKQESKDSLWNKAKDALNPFK